MKENDMIENAPGQPDQTSRNGGNPSPSGSGNGKLTGGDRRRAPRPPRARYTHRHHRRTGKVARLPAVIRNEICLRFTRYEEYKHIIAWLASQGHPNISESNLSRWRNGGFRDWLLKEQEKRIDLITTGLEVLTGLIIREKNAQSTPGHSQAHSSCDDSSNHPIIHSSDSPQP